MPDPTPTPNFTPTPHPHQAAADPEMMPYFFLQHDDYITLKERTAAHVLAGKEGTPDGIATIDIAIDALKVAEYLTPLLTAALK